MDVCRRLAGKTVLVVENEWWIANDLRCVLADEGAHVLGPVATVGNALLLIHETFRIDGAVLDIHLNHGSNVYPVAEALRALDVPFIFATGCDGAGIRCEFGDVPLLTKPYAINIVGKVLVAASLMTRHLGF